MVICRGKSSNMRLLRPRSCCCVTSAEEHAWFHSCQLLQEQDGEARAVGWLIAQIGHSEEWETFPATTNINYNVTVGVRLWCKSSVWSTIQCDESKEPFLGVRWAAVLDLNVWGSNVIVYLHLVPERARSFMGIIGLFRSVITVSHFI